MLAEKYIKFLKGYGSKKKGKKGKKLVSIFGGKCQICGYQRCLSSLDFHHVNPSKKENTFSVMGILAKWEKIVNEVKKCVMICANCHREIHAGIMSFQKVNEIYENTSVIISAQLNKELQKSKKLQIQSNFCTDCNKKIDQRSKRCIDCYNIYRNG